MCAIVPVISKSRLFLCGMAAQCPALDPLIRRVETEPAESRQRCWRLLEQFFRLLPELPAAPAEDLLSKTDDEIAGLARGQKDEASLRLHRRWQSVRRDAAGADDFATRIAVLLTELIRRSRASRISAINAS